jgi:putative ABC transport system permease protein
MRQLLYDVRCAIRFLIKNPGFTAAAVLTLAIAIGSNTAILGIVDGVLLRPLPYAHPDRLVSVMAADGDRRGYFNLADFQDLVQAAKSFEIAGGYANLNTTLETVSDGPSQIVDGVMVTPNFFEVLGIPPVIGRAFSQDDAEASASIVAVISHQFWQRYFGGDTNVAGKEIQLLNQPPITVIGVLPDRFLRPSGSGSAPQIWITMTPRPGFPPPSPQIFGRLREGVTLEAARAELSSIYTGIVQSRPQRGRMEGISAVTLHDQIVQSQRTNLLIFSGAVLCVLFLGLVNLVNLEMSRLPLIERELSIRSALGASRGMLVRFMLTKTMLLTLAGGVLGIAIGYGTYGALLSRLPFYPRIAELSFDARIVVFATALSVMCGLLIAIVPAVRASMPDLGQLLNSATRSHTGSKLYRRFQGLMIGFETAVALTLLLGAGLLTNSFLRLMSVDSGFAVDGIAALQVRLPPTYADAARQRSFVAAALERYRALGDVKEAAVTSNLPGSSRAGFPVLRETPTPSSETVGTSHEAVSGNYFATLGIALLAGRTITDTDSNDGSTICVVSETLARNLWPGMNPLGQQLRRQNGRPFTVVGVVSDVRRLRPVEQLEPAMYTPLLVPTSDRDVPGRSLAFVIRSASPAALQRIITEAEPKAVVTSRTMNEVVGNLVSNERFRTTVIGAFAGLALLLAAIGIYGVIAFTVASSTREIGIRIAVGARSSEIFIHVVRRAFIPTSLGMGVGLAVSVALSKVLTSYLFTLSPTDGETYVVVTITMLLVVIAACWIPAFRALKIDPVIALRAD